MPSLQRLDPAVMHISTIQAGTLLARLGRPEVSNCTAGLEQYSYSYEEAGEHAREMRRLYDRCLAGDLEFNHMASVAPRVVISPPPVPVDHAAMMVDEPMQGVSAGRVVGYTFFVSPSSSSVAGSADFHYPL